MNMTCTKKSVTDDQPRIEFMDLTSNDYLTKCYPDVHFTTSDDQALFFHRFILINYEYFAVMLHSGFQESATDQPISHLKLSFPYSLSQTLLTILYRDFRSQVWYDLITDQNVFELYRCAHQLQLQFILYYCIKYMYTMKFSLELFHLCRIYEIIHITNDNLAHKYLSLSDDEQQTIDHNQLDIKFWIAYTQAMLNNNKSLTLIWHNCLKYVDPSQLPMLLALIKYEHLISADLLTLSDLLPQPNAIILTQHVLKLISPKLILPHRKSLVR